MAKVVRAMLPIIMSLVVSLLYLIVIANGIRVHSFEERKKMMMFNAQMLQRKHQLGDSYFATGLFPKSRQEKGAVILEMRNKDHWSENKINSWNRWLYKQLILDNHRVRSMQTMIRKMVSTQNLESSLSQIPLDAGPKFGSANYVVTAELGGQKMALEIDTGSVLTWVQCEPCNTCFDQALPVFNPSNSSSYQTVPCNSSVCETIYSSNSETCESDSSSCSYEIDYADESYTSGELGVDNFTVGDVSESSFVFGCGYDNNGLFGKASGVLGLGKGELSLVSQSEKLGGVFSYCLPRKYDGASGSLVFGNDSSFFKNETPISYTNMVLNPLLPNLYLLNLTGIKVGDVDLQVPSFGSTDGVVIDSGTAITRLTPSIYDALKEEFLRQFSQFPQVPGFDILDTCFNVTEPAIFPTIRMYFEGNVELNVDADGTFVSLTENGSIFCLAIASLSDDSEISIIGNFQQINQRVIYDTKESVMGFARETCSLD